jgi:hypothetical protein
MSLGRRVEKLEQQTFGSGGRCPGCGNDPAEPRVIECVIRGHGRGPGDGVVDLPPPAGLLPQPPRPPCPLCGEPAGPVRESCQDSDGDLWEDPAWAPSE